jgi:predicted permease
MLLAVGGLFVSSLTRLMSVQTGLTPDGAVSMEIAPVAAKYPDIAERAALYDRISERVRALPGVTASGWTSALPLTGETWVDPVARPDSPPDSHRPAANYRFIGPEYFAAVGTPIFKGRSIATTDRTSSPTAAVINARTAQALWPGEDPIGREFTRSDPSQRFQVVGVVPDHRVTALESAPPLMVYVPYWFNNEGKSILVVRAAGDPLDLAPALRAAVREVDRDVAIARIAPLEQVVDSAVESRRHQASLFTAFGAGALFIAALGIYSTTAYGVSRRRRELNIRVALGARVVQVFSLVLRQSLVPLGAGLLAGLVGALALGRAVASLLFEVQPRDPSVLGSVLLVMMVTGMVAAAVATFGGLRIDPASALRHE